LLYFNVIGSVGLNKFWSPWVPYATILEPIVNYFKILDEKSKIFFKQLFLEGEREFNFV